MFRTKQGAIMGLVALVVAAIWANALFSIHPTLEVTFLDVGEGSCIIAKGPTGRTLVMDCGTSSWRDNEIVGEKLAAQYLQSIAVDTIDVVILSHPHSDHVSGMPGLLRAKPARLVMDLGFSHGSPLYRRFLKAVKKSKAVYRRARRGQRIDLGGGAVATILNPDPSRRYANLNDHSIALRITYGDAAVLLAADVGKETEHEILASGANVRAQVLQVGHHGSAQSTSDEWLQAVRPELAIISCARHSRYRHPSRDVVRKLRAYGARVYCTAWHGAVTVTTDGRTINVKTYGKSQ